MNSFIHLRVHTAYSLLEGALKIPDLVALALKHRMPAIAMTDRDNLFGSAEFSAEAAAKGIQPIIGCQFSFEPMVVSARQSQPEQLLIYAKDQAGYQNLLHLASATYLAPERGVAPSLSYDTLARHSEGLLALTGGIYGALGRALLANRSDEAAEVLTRLKTIFPDRLYVELMRHGMPEEKSIETAMIELAYAQDLPLIATNDIYFDGGAEMYEAHDALLCIAGGRYVTETNRRRLTPEHRFKSAEEMRLLFADLPEAIENTRAFAERCAVMSPKRPPMLPGFTELASSEAALTPTLSLKEKEPLKPSPSGRGLGEGHSRQPKELIKIAKQLRQNLTDAERLLWAILRDRQLEDMKFRRQQAIDHYVADFFSHEANLIVELEGGQHAEEKNQRKDDTRTAYFESKGYRVLRFWNHDVLENIEGVVDVILEALTPTLSLKERELAKLSSLQTGLEEGSSVDQLPVEQSEETLLRRRAAEGLRYRLETLVYEEDLTEDQKAAIAEPYLKRLAFELDVITQMQFSGYFLIVSDFITWSKRQGIPVGPGRGSGAASVVAWSLLITDLDPLKFDLIFERFLNPERVSMPDFDIDFCQDRRDEVIRYVQGRYGADKVAQIITFGKLQARAVLRDVGRVLQMPYGQVDRICKLVPNNPANPVTLAQAIAIEPMLRRMRQDEESVAKLIDISLRLEGLYRHSSTHAAGVVIGDRPLEELVPLYRDPKSEMPVVQYSMKYAETSGLVKFDFLGLKTLTVLDHTLRHIAKRGITIDLLKLPEGDPKTYALLTRGDTVGVFQFESAGMRDSLRRLKPDCLDDLIALGALYRPGPMDNIPMYCNRKHGREKPDYLHPLLEPVLKETFGVIIYQEQVQQIAQVLAGYTLGGADLLRRAMGKKIKEEMQAQRATFIEGAAKNDVSTKKAGEIFDLVDKFAGYGFNKAHAAAYALIGYQTAYLKANYPVEFLAASMTYDMHNTDKLAIFCEDAKKLGHSVLPPDANASGAVFTVEARGEGGLSVRYALAAIKNVGEAAMQAIVAEREGAGPFADMFDFVTRIDPSVLNKRQMEQLVKAGAFDGMHPNRRQLFESIDLLLSYGQATWADKHSTQISLFGEARTAHPHPALPVTPDWTTLNRLENEFLAIGFYLSTHPLEGYESALKRLGVITYAALCERLPVPGIAVNYEKGGRAAQYTTVQLAGIVTGKKMKSSDKGRFAFVQLSDRTAVYEVSIFDETVLDTRRDLLENGAMVILRAEAKMEESGPRIIVGDIKALGESAASVPCSDRIEITLEKISAIEAIRKTIGKPVDKGSRISILASVRSTQMAEIALPGCYRMTPADILDLQTLDGIRRVSEKPSA